jgi:hypothetical protein
MASDQKCCLAKFQVQNFTNTKFSTYPTGDALDALDSQEHLLWCSSYAELRMGKNLVNEKDLVSYYRDILKQKEGEE